MNRPLKTAVETARGPMTVLVSRSRIHQFGSNGWDLLLWLASWLVRMVLHDQTWQVTVRAGAPRLWSGTQARLYSEQMTTFAAAVPRAEEIADSLEHDTWPAQSTPVDVPRGREWLSPTSKGEAAVRLIALFGMISMLGAFALLELAGASAEPSNSLGLGLGIAGLVVVVLVIFSTSAPSRRRAGAHGFVLEAFSPEQLKSSAGVLGLPEGFVMMLVTAVGFVAIALVVLSVVTSFT